MQLQTPPPSRNELVEKEGLEVAASADSPGYDGQFFLALAFDPFLRTPLSEVLDDAEYRARRITWSLAAWSLGAGNARARLGWLHLLLIACAGGLGVLLADQAHRHGRSPWWGLAGALGLGSLVCLQRMTGDLVMTFLLVAMACALDSEATADGGASCRRYRLGLATTFFVMAVLQKETALLALPMLAIPLFRRRTAASLFWLVLSTLVVASWWVYVERVTPAEGPFSPTIPFALPAAGFVVTLGWVIERAPDFLRLAKDLTLMATHGAAILLGIGIGAREAWRAFRGPVVAQGLPLSIGLFAGLGLVLSERVWSEPWAYARVLLPLLSLELLYGLKPESGRWVRWGVSAIILVSFLGGWLFALHNLWARNP